MRLPRWLVACLLTTSAVAVIAAPMWCWVAWPQRTIGEFTTLLEQGRFGNANQYLIAPAHLAVEEMDGRELVKLIKGQPSVGKGYIPLYSTDDWQRWCTLENLQIDSRSIADFLCGRQKFSFHRQFTTPVFIGGHAERGSIVLRYENWAAH